MKKAVPLTPALKVDKNGKTVTRWVKMLDTGEAGINLPSPQSPALEQFAESVYEKMFPSQVSSSGYIVDLAGYDYYYTPSFVKHALETLPPKTLRKLRDELYGESEPSRLQVHLSNVVQKYIAAMYENVNKDDVQDSYEPTVRDINNALVFYEALDSLSATMSHISPLDYEYLLNDELTRYEKTVGNWEERPTGEFGETTPSLIDYSALPARKQREAIAYVIASRLMRSSATPRSKPSKEFVKLTQDSLDRQKDFIDMVKSRGTDTEVLREVMSTDTPSLSSGIL